MTVFERVEKEIKIHESRARDVYRRAGVDSQSQLDLQQFVNPTYERGKLLASLNRAKRARRNFGPGIVVGKMS